MLKQQSSNTIELYLITFSTLFLCIIHHHSVLTLSGALLIIMHFLSLVVHCDSSCWEVFYLINCFCQHNKTNSVAILSGTSATQLIHIHTVKPAHVVTCIKRSHFSCLVIDNFIWIEPLLRGHLTYKDTFPLSQRWPLYTGLAVFVFRLVSCQMLHTTGVVKLHSFSPVWTIFSWVYW